MKRKRTSRASKDSTEPESEAAAEKQPAPTDGAVQRMPDAGPMAVGEADAERLRDATPIGADEAHAERLLDRWGSLEKEFVSVRAERDRLRAEVDAHGGKLSEQQRSVAAYRGQVETLQEELALTRRRLEERTAALEGRQSGRSSAERRLADYRDALLGMEHTLAERERAMLKHAAEKAELTARMAELERQLAEITGRWRESEAANARLQTMLTEAARAGERLEVESARARKEAEQLARQAAEKSAALAKLETARVGQSGQAGDSAARLRELNSTLKAEQKRNAGLAARAREREDEVAMLQAALDQERAAAEAARQAQSVAEKRLVEAASKAEGDRPAGKELRGQLAGVREELARREAQVAELESRTAKLERDAAATEKVAGLAVAARDRVADELQQKLDVIAGLEKRVGELIAELQEQREPMADVDPALLRQRRNTIAVLGREIERVDAIEAGVRKHDELMARHAAAAGDAERRRKARLIVSLEGDHNIKYPLYKPAMVIGRSSDADIHVIGRFTSRRHARILILDDDSAVIEDLGSLNGIRVNDQAVTRHTLHDGDVLDVGGARLQFVDLGEQEAAHSNTG